MSVRARVEVVGVGVLEAHPFFRATLAGPDWPDGTHRAALRPSTGSFWTLERAPRGWCATPARGKPVFLAPHEETKVGEVRLKLRPSPEPLAHVRMRLRGFELLDVAWPLSREAPRRLAAYAGRLVELLADEADARAPPDAIADFVLGTLRWSALPARFGVPLRHVVEAGAGSPVPHGDVDAYEVDLDGALRAVPLGLHEPRWPPLVSAAGAGDGALFPGVVQGLFPERVREWRELEEQVATMPPASP